MPRNAAATHAPAQLGRREWLGGRAPRRASKRATKRGWARAPGLALRASLSPAIADPAVADKTGCSGAPAQRSTHSMALRARVLVGREPYEYPGLSRGVAATPKHAF